MGAEVYKIDINYNNNRNTSFNDVTMIDFVGFNFNTGSFNYISDWQNVTLGFYNGTLYGWDFNLGIISKVQISYSITKNTINSKVIDNYMVGLE